MWPSICGVEWGTAEIPADSLKLFEGNVDMPEGETVLVEWANWFRIWEELILPLIMSVVSNGKLSYPVLNLTSRPEKWRQGQTVTTAEACENRFPSNQEPRTDKFLR